MTTLATYMSELRELSSSDLTHSIENLADEEKRRTAQVIAHLAEISGRKLHLELGCKSLHEYCVERLGLSDGCAWLRIQVSRVCLQFPRLLDDLWQGSVSLTVAGKLAPHLTEENCERLLSDCGGMTKREVEEYLVGLAPKRVVSAGVRKRPAMRGTSPSSESRGDSDPFTTRREPLDSRSSARASPPRSGSVEPCRPETYNVRFAADKQFMDKLERAAEVAGVLNAHRNLAQVIEKALDVFLEKQDPQRRQQRCDSRQARKAAKATGGTPRPDEVVNEPNPPEPAKRSRHIPLPIRDRLLEKAGHQCQYVSSEGVRCTERTLLVIDHIEPWGRGGTSEEANLRVLCGPHNGLHAQRCYGEEFVTGRISAARESTRHRREGPPGSAPRLDEVALPWSIDPEEGVCEAVASYEAVGTPGALPYAWLRGGWVGL